MEIRISSKKRTSPKVVKRRKNKARIRKKIHGSAERPRLTVFRSANHTYAQLVDDTQGRTLAAASTLKAKDTASPKTVEGAKSVGQAIAEKAMAQNIKSVVFDRSGYVYHGRVRAVAEAAREAGLQF